MHCFKTRIETGIFKRIIDQFLLVDKEKEKLLAEKFAFVDFKLVSLFTAEGVSCCETKAAKLLKNFQVLSVHCSEGNSVLKWNFMYL